MPNGPSRNAPPSRSSSDPKTLGESKRGTHSQSIAPSGAIRAPVWQFERNAYSAIGGNGDGIAALWGIDGFVSGFPLGLPSTLAFAFTVLMTPPTARASGRARQRGACPPPDPTIPSRTGGRAAARRAAAA